MGPPMPRPSSDCEGVLGVTSAEAGEEVRSITEEGVVAFESNSESEILINTGNRRVSPSDELGTEGPGLLEGDSVKFLAAVASL